MPDDYDLQPVDHDPFRQLAPQGALAQQVSGFPQRAADMAISALGPLGEAGMTVGDWLRTGNVDARDVAPMLANTMLGIGVPPGARAAEAAVPAVADVVREAEPEMVAAFNKALPSIQDQYNRWAGANHSYQVLTPKDAAGIYGDDLPDDLRQVLDAHGRAVEISSDNQRTEYFNPPEAPTYDQHMRDVVESEGGMLPVQSLDRAYDTLANSRGIDPIFANGEALKILARKLGWEPTKGVKYFSLNKDAYAPLDVRVSDHPNLTRSNPNATTPDINLAPGADDYRDATRIMMQQEPEEIETEPVEHDPFSDKPQYAKGGSVKSSKKQADYHLGTKAKRCADCTMFEPPHRCSAVSGTIYPSGVCKFFERKAANKAA